MKTYVYIDGFNLYYGYYGAVQYTKYKWLNLKVLCEQMLPQHEILCIKYFTAPVKGRPDDPDQPVRQNTYIRALETIPHLRVFFGTFLEQVKSRPIADCCKLAIPGQYPRKLIKVVISEERGKRFRCKYSLPYAKRCLRKEVPSRRISE